jgi:hypothetical protein
MRTLLLIAIAGILLNSCTQSPQTHQNQLGQKAEFDSTDATNDFYDNAPTYKLKSNNEIKIAGEVTKTANRELDKFPKRSVIVKETLLKRKTDSFVGAYKYSGYSLYDILNDTKLDKANKEQFSPIIDLYVVVNNPKGEKAVLSWGEIYYPNNRHKNIIATKVTPIIPSKTKEQWPLPEQSKLVVGNDLLDERNISNPTRIEIHSLKGNYPEKEQDKLYAPSIAIRNAEGKQLRELKNIPEEMHEIEYPSVFYGRGRGIHGVTSFKGYLLKDLLKSEFPVTANRLQEGLFLVAAPDGYRAAFSYSEIFNRNDQSEVLLLDLGDNMENGKFRTFPAGDFFSDRAIKAVSEIQYRKVE